MIIVSVKKFYILVSATNKIMKCFNSLKAVMMEMSVYIHLG